MAKKNKPKKRKAFKPIDFKRLIKYVVPFLIGGVVVVSLYNVKTEKINLSFYLEEDCFAIQDKQTLNSLDAGNFESTKLVALSTGTAVYSDDSGKNISIGEEKLKINDDYPLFARSGEVIYFINDKNTLINSYFEELPTYEGLRVIEGNTYNINDAKADFDNILFVKIGSLYQVAQETTLASNIANRTINKNTICEFKADSINCYELFGDQIRSYRIPVYGDTKITIGDSRLSYSSLLENLGLIKSNSEKNEEEETDILNPSGNDEDDERESTGKAEETTVVAEMPTIKTDLPNTIQPLQPERPDDTPPNWKMCEISVDPNASSWTYLVSFNVITQDEASIVKNGVKFFAWDKTVNTTPPSITQASVAEDSIPRQEGWYEKKENEFGVVQYIKTRDREPGEDKPYYICNDDVSKLIWIKKLFYVYGYAETAFEGNDIPDDGTIFEKNDDGSGNVSYSVTADTQVQEGKTYYKQKYVHVVSNDDDNPSANGWYEKVGESFVLTSDTSISSTCYKVGKQKNRSSFPVTIDKVESLMDVGQLEPNSEYLLGYEYDYLDKTGSVETVSEYLGIYSTGDYNQLNTISLSFDGDNNPDLEVFQNKLQIRGMRFDNVYNGEEAYVGDLKVAQALSDNKKAETYITKMDIQYQVINYDSSHARLAPTESWSKLSLESSAINVLKKGFKLVKWDSDTKLSFGKEFYYRVKLYDKYGYEFIYEGNMSDHSSPAIFTAYTSKNVPTVNITVPSTSNKVGSVIVNTNIKNDAHVPISNFVGQFKGQDLSSYQGVMFFTSANDECIPENAIAVKGIRTNSDGTTSNFDSNGIYYLPISTMGVVPDELSGNPSSKGWYELIGSTYELSTDTSKASSKTYYFDDGVNSSYKITSLSSNTSYNVGVMLGSFDCNDNKEHRNEILQSTFTFICGSLKNYGSIQYSGTTSNTTHNDAKINVRLSNNSTEQLYDTVLNSIIQYIEFNITNEGNNSTTKLTIFKDKNGYNLNSNDPKYIFPYNPEQSSYEFLVPVYINDNFDDVYFMTLRCELSNPTVEPKYKLKDIVTDEVTEDTVSNVWNFLLSTSNTVDANYWSFNCVDFLKLEDSSSSSGYTTINTPLVSLEKNSNYRVTMNIFGTNDNISYENLVSASSKAITFKTTKQEPTADFADVYIGDDFIEIYNLSFSDPDHSIEASNIPSDQNNAYIQIKYGDQVISKYNVNTALDFVQIDDADIVEGTSPKDNLWFEKNGEEYVITQDAVVDSVKTYYKKYYSLIRISGLIKNTNYSLSILAKNFNNGKDKSVDYPLVLSALSSYNNQVRTYDFYTSSLISGEINLKSMYRLYYDGPTSDSEQKKTLGLVSANDWEYDESNRSYVTKDYIPLKKGTYYSLRTGLESDDSYVSTLPESLKELEYIEVASANQYISTNYYANTNTVVEIKGLLTTATSLIGNNPSDSTWFNLTGSGNTYRYRNGPSTTYDFGTIDSDPHTFELSSSRVLYDGTEISTPIATTDFTATIPSTIFARKNLSGVLSDYAGAGSRIYYLKISENETLIHDFVPCQALEAIPDYMTNNKLRVSAGTVGLFDTITETFYINSGPGNFVAPSVSDTGEDSSYVSMSVYQKMNDTTYNLIETYTGNLLFNGNLFMLDNNIYTGDNYCAKLSFSHLPDSYSISNIVFEEFSDEKVDAEHNLTDLLQGTKSFVDNTIYDKDGNRITVEGYSITNDFMEVLPDSVYYIEGLSDYSTNYYSHNRTGSTISQAISEQTASSHNILFYNEGKEYVGYVVTGAQGSLFKTPANAKYMKLYIRGKQTNVDYSSVDYDTGLPSGYQQVQYVQATSNAYINTGIYGGSSTRVIYDFSASSAGQDLFGARTAGKNKSFLIYKDANQKITQKYYNTEVSTSVALPADAKFIRFDISNNVSKIYKDGDQLITSITNNPASFNTAYTLHFPGYNNKGTHGNASEVKIFSMKIYYPLTSLVRDYVPCYRKTDGVVGFYDLVSRTFSASATSTPFTKGPDVGEDDIQQLRVGVPYKVNSQAEKVRRDDDKYTIPFYPKVNGTYSIYTSNLFAGDPYLSLYDEDKILVAHDDDSAGNHNAKITYDFNSCRKYYKPNTFIETIPPVDNPKNNGWYEYSSTYVLTNDTTPVSSKTYYNKQYTIDTTTYPIKNVLYEIVNNNYVLTQDENRQSGKEYYKEEYEIATPYVANPKEEYWYERQGSNYILSTDTSASSSKHYYLPSTFVQVSLSGDENPKELNLYIKENGTYYKSTSDHPEPSVYYIRASHSNQFIASEIMYDVHVSDYQYSYSYDNLGIYLYQSANLDYFNIEVEAKINQEADKTIDKEYFKNVDGEIVPISENDLIAMYDLGDTPAGLGWYEEKYTLSSDIDIDPSKNYYTEKCRYELTEVSSGDNPSSLGLYERISSKYVLSTDTSASSSKKYFIKHTNNQFTLVTGLVSPADNGWYELSYVPTTDTSIAQSPFYYAQGGTAKIVLYKTKNEIKKDDNLELFEDDKWVEYKTMYSYDDIIGASSIRLGEIDDDYIISSIVESNYGYKVVLSVNREGKSGQTVLDYINVSALQPTYIIKDIPSLKAVATNPTGYYICIADIKDVDFCVYDGIFTGVIDFQGHTIELTSNNYLFKQLSSEAVIKNANFVYDPLVNKPSEDKQLPAGYTQIESITGNGTQYINTGYIHKPTSKYVFEVNINKINVSGVWGAMFGSRPSSGFNNSAAFFYHTSGYYAYNAHGGSVSLPAHSVVFEKWNKITFTQQKIEVNDKQYIINKNINNGGYPDYLFAVNQAGSPRNICSMSMKYFQIYEGDTLVRDFVPCISPTGKVGMYDKQTNLFYDNVGTGEFLADVSYSEDGSTISGITSNTSINYSNLTNCLGGDTATLVLNNYGTLNNIIMHYAPDTEVHEIYNEDIYYFEVSDEVSTKQYRLVGNDSWSVLSSSGYELCHPDSSTKNKMLQIGTGLNVYSYSNETWRLESSTDSYILPGDVELTPEKISGLKLVNSEYIQKRTSPFTLEVNTGGLVLNNYGTISGFAMNFENDVYVKDNVAGIALNNYGTIKNGYVSGSKIANNTFMSGDENGTHYAGFIHRMNYFTGVTISGSSFSYNLSENQTRGSYISYVSSYNNSKSNIENVYVVNDLRFQSGNNAANEYGAWDAKETNIEATLPSGFIAVDCIKTEGNNYIDTNLSTNDNITKVTADFSLDNLYNASMSLFGAGISGYATTGLLLTLNPAVTGNHYLYGGNYTAFTYTWQKDRIYSIEAYTNDTNRVLTINGATIVDTAMNKTISPNLKYYIFANSETSTVARYARGFLLYGLKMYQGDKCVRDYVPCVAIENVSSSSTGNGRTAPAGTMGLYDLVTNKFYFTSGTGALSYPTNTATIEDENYQQVEYIESFSYGTGSSSSGQVINTNVSFQENKTYAWDIDFAISKFNGGETDIMGVSSGSYNFVVGSNSSKQWLSNGHIDGTSYHSAASASVDTNVKAKGSTKPTSTINEKLYLFAQNNGGSPTNKSSFKLFSAKIYEDNVLIRNYIPCFRKIDKRPGLYDLVSNTFVSNSGDGEFYYDFEKVPVEYQRVDFIKSNGNQIIDTGYVHNINTKYEAIISGAPPSSGYTGLFGAQNSANSYNGSLSIFTQSGNKLYYRNNANGVSYSTDGYSFGTSYMHIICSASTLQLNSKVLATYSLSSYGPNTYNCYLFAVNNKNAIDSTKRTTSLRRFKISEWDETSHSYILLHDYVPCYEKATKVIGLYDLVAGEFKTNAGSGTFTKGKDINVETVSIERRDFTLFGTDYSALICGYNEGNISNSYSVGDLYDFDTATSSSSIQYDEYEILNYVESNAKQHVSLGFTPTSNSKIELDYQFLVNSSSSQVGQVGCGTANNSRRAFIQATSPNFTFGLGPNITSSFPKNVDRHVYTLDIKNKKGLVDGVVVATSTVATISPDKNFFIFSRNDGGTVSNYYHTARFYGLKYYENEVLKKVFVPAMRISDGKIGILETNTMTFCLSSGTIPLTSGGSVGSSEGVSASLTQRFNGQTIMYRSGPTIGATVNLGKNSNIKYASLDTDGLTYYNKKSWGSNAKSYMHNDNVGITALSLSNTQWQEQMLGPDGKNFMIKDYLSSSKFPTLAWPTNFPSSSIPLIDIPSISSGLRILSNTVKMKGVDENNNQSALVCIDFYNPSKINVNSVSIVDDSDDGERELTSKVIGCTQIEGAMYRLDVLITFAGRDVVAETNADVTSVSKEKIEFADGTTYNLISQKPLVSIDDFNLEGQVIAVSAKAQEVYRIVSINGNGVGNSGENEVRLDFYNSIGSISDWKKNFVNVYSSIEGNFRLISDLDFKNSVPSDWHINYPFNGILNGAIYQIDPVEVVDSIGNTYLDANGSPVIIYSEGELIGMRTIRGVGNVNAQNEYAPEKGNTSPTDALSYESSSSSKFSLFYKLDGTLENIIFDDFVTTYNKQLHNSLYDVTTPICGVVQIAENGSTIDNCHVRNSSFNTRGIGGALVGYAIGSNIINSSVKDSTITSYTLMSASDATSLGGLVGYLNNSLISNSYVSNVSIDNSNANSILGTGGLIGVADYSTIQACYAAGGSLISNGDFSGGLIGKVGKKADSSSNEYDYKTSIDNCWTSINVQTNKGDFVGGLVGYMGIYNGSGIRDTANRLTNCYTSSTVLSLSYDSTHINRITSFDYDNQGYYSNNFAFVSQSLNYKTDSTTEVGAYQFGPLEELRGASRLIKSDEIRKPRTWIDEMKFDTSFYELSLPDGQELIYMPKLLNSKTGQVLYGQNDEQLGIDDYAELTVVELHNNRSGNYLSITFDLRNSGWDQDELLTYNNDLTQNKWNDLATWSGMYCSGGQVDFREEGAVSGLYIKPISVRYEGSKAVVRFVTDIYYGDPDNGHYANKYLLSIPVFLNSPNTTPRLSQNTYALIIVDESNKIRKDIYDAREWNEFFAADGSHYNTEESIRLTGNKYNFDAYTLADGSMNGGSGQPAYNARLSSLEIAENVNPVFTGLIEYKYLNDASFISSLSGNVSGITFEDFTIDYGNSSCSTAAGIIGQIDGNFKNIKFDNVSIKNIDSDNVGLIGNAVKGAVIEDISINNVNVSVVGSHDNIGAFVGSINGVQNTNVVVKNVTATSTKVDTGNYNSSNVGGLFGSVSYADLESITVDANRKDANTTDSFEDIDYIEASGRQYIDLGITNIGDWKIDTRVNMTDDGGSKNYIAGNAGNLSIYTDTDGYLYASINNNGSHASSYSRNTNRDIDLSWDDVDSININGQECTLSDLSAIKNNTLSNSLCLFSNGTNQATYSSLKMYYFTIHDGENTIMHLVPKRATHDNTVAYRGTSSVTVKANTIGLYDTVSNKFYVSSTNNDFTNENIVPSMFKQVEYIQSSYKKKQYIKTGVSLQDGYRIVGQGSELTSNSATEYRALIGAGKSDTPNTSVLIGWKAQQVDGSIQSTYNGATATTAPTNTVLHFDMAAGVSGSYAKCNAFSAPSRTSNYPISSNELIIFATSGDGASGIINYSTSRIYSLKIYYKDYKTLRRNFIPVIANENIAANLTNTGVAVNKGTAGLYDTVTGLFFVNSGTDHSNFIYPTMTNDLPNELQQVEYIQSMGNAYIDTGLYADANSTIDIDFNINKELYYKDSESEKTEYIFGNVGYAVKAYGTSIAASEDIMTIATSPINTNHLPTEYTELAYIMTDQTQWLDTGVPSNTISGIDLGYAANTTIDNSRSIISGVLNDFTVATNTPTGYNIRLKGTSIKNVSTGASTNTMNTIRLFGGKFYFNNSQVTTYSVDRFATNEDNLILGNNVNTSAGARAKYYYLKIWQNGNSDANHPDKHFIPCYRNSDHEVGMYDIVNNEFYSSSSVYSFIPGSIYVSNVTLNSFNYSTRHQMMMNVGSNQAIIDDEAHNINCIDDYSSVNTSGNVMLFMVNDGVATHHSDMTLYHYAQYDSNNNLVRNLIPAFAKSTVNYATRNGATNETVQKGTVGLYDTVSRKFFVNAGGGELICENNYSRLPSNYQRLMYVSGNGAQTLDTGVRDKLGYTYEIKYSNSLQTKAGIFGGNGRGLISNEVGNYTLYVDGSTPSNVTGYYSDVTVSKLKDSYLMNLDTGAGTSIVTAHNYDDDDTGSTMTVFNVNGSGLPSDYGDVYYLKAWDERGKLIRDYVPCVDNIGQAGLYDLVNRQFIGNVIAGIALPENEYEKYIYEDEFDYDYNNVTSGSAGPAAGVAAYISNTNIKDLHINRINVFAASGSAAGVIGESKASNTVSSIDSITNINVYGGANVAGFAIGGTSRELDLSRSYVVNNETNNVSQGTKVNNIKVVGGVSAGFVSVLPTSSTLQNFIIKNERIYAGSYGCGGFSADSSVAGISSDFNNFIVDNVYLYNDVNTTDSRNCGGIGGYVTNAVNVKNVITNDVKIRANGYGSGGLFGNTSAFSITDSYTSNIDIISNNNYSGGVVGQYITSFKNTNNPVNNIYIKAVRLNGGLYGRFSSGTGTNQIEDTPVENININVTDSYSGCIGGQSQAVNLTNVPVDRVVIKGTASNGGLFGWINNNVTFNDSPVSNIYVYGSSTSSGGILGVYSGTSGSHGVNGNGNPISKIEIVSYGTAAGGVMGGVTGNYVGINNCYVTDGSVTSLTGISGGIAGIGWNCSGNVVGQADHATSNIPGVESSETADVIVNGKSRSGGILGHQVKYANQYGHLSNNSVYNTYIYSSMPSGTVTYVSGIVSLSNQTPGNVTNNLVENCTLINDSNTAASHTAGILATDSSDSTSVAFNTNTVKDTVIIGNNSMVGGITGKVKRTDEFASNVVQNSVIIGKENTAGIVVERNRGNVTKCGIEDTIILSTNGSFVGGIIANANLTTFDNNKPINLTYDYVRSSGVLKGYTLQDILNNVKSDRFKFNVAFMDEIQNTYTNHKNLVSNLDRYNTIIMSNAISSGSDTNSVGGIAGYYNGRTINNCYVGKDVLISSRAVSEGQAYVGGLIGTLDNSALVNLNADANISNSKIQTVTNSVCQANIFYGGNNSINSAVGGLFGAYRHTAFTTKLLNNKYYQSWDYNKIIGIDPSNISNILYTGNISTSSLETVKTSLIVGREFKTSLPDSSMNTMAGSGWTHDSTESTILAYPVSGDAPTYTPSTTINYGGSLGLTKSSNDLFYFDGYDTCKPKDNGWLESNGSGGFVSTEDTVPVLGKNYYASSDVSSLQKTFYETYGQTIRSRRAEGVGRFRTNNTLVLTPYDGVTSDSVTNHSHALYITDSQIGDGTDASNNFLYTGNISLGNMKLDTWFAGVWDGPKVAPLALTSRRPILSMSNGVKNDATKLINELQVYSSGIDTFNLELKNCPEDELKYTITSLSDTISMTWPNGERTVSFTFDYSSDIQITLDYNGQTAEKTISAGDLCKSITTSNDSYWYLYQNKVMDKNNNSINNTRTFVHLYDNYALDSTGNVLDLNDDNKITKSISGLALIDQVKPLWEGYVVTDNEEHLVRTFRTYSKSDNLIIDNSQLYVIDSELLSFSTDKTIVSGPIFMMYGSKKYGSVLNSTGSLIDYGEELTYPDGFVNDDIKEISDNIDYNDRVALVRYNSGKLVAFDVLTGESVNVLSDEKIIQSLFSFIGSNLKSLLSPSSSKTSTGVLGTVNSYEDQVDSSASLKRALEELDNELTSVGGSISSQEEITNNEQDEQDDNIQEETPQSTETNSQETNVNNEGENTTAQETPQTEAIAGIDKYVVNNKYISIYNEETKEHNIYKASQLLNADKDTILSEEQKAKKLEEKGFKVSLDAKETKKTEEANGLIIMIMIAIGIIALVSILLFTKLGNIFKED